MNTQTLHGYVCFYNQQRFEVRAASQYAAKLAAIAHFKVRKNKEHMVSAVLAEKNDGTPVVHTAVD